METDVIIVGAGPTGLMAANQLAHFGIKFVILDANEGPTEESRAILVSARSLEVYQQLGLINQVLKQGRKVETMNVYSDGEFKFQARLGDLGTGLSEFPYLHAFEQSKNETLLVNNLEKLGTKVRWKTEFKKYRETKRGVTVSAMHKGKPLEIKAKYLIGCDGAHSPIRHQLGLEFPGGTYENKFIVADVEIDWDFDYNRIILNPERKNFFAFIPLSGNKNYRIIGALPRKYHEIEDISFDDVVSEIRKGIKFRLDFGKLNWFSVYRLHHRSVNKFSKGRIFLAGDSAHIHSPAGGQGMNTGLLDASNIAWKMAMVLNGHASEKLLDTYNEERLPFAKWLIKTTDKGFTTMTKDSLFGYLVRKYLAFKIIPQALRKESLRQKIFTMVSQIWYSYAGKSISLSVSRQKLRFKAGDRLPYLDRYAPGTEFYKQFKAGSWHLLHISDKKIGKDQQRQIDNVIAFPFKKVESELSEAWGKFGIKKELFVLVRPDNYVGFIFDTPEQLTSPTFIRVLQEYFNLELVPDSELAGAGS